ncbi:MAG: sugar ABC transporter ATP-binding protein [Ancalomicrobiaceae bacterium]|nr:sugar ABC transporter ATP-binding protein [Ancalomicrobiaceae bacterium]
MTIEPMVDSNEPPVLALSGVCKRFPGMTVLQGVGFTLRRGEVTALIGENGAGKSTLVKILTGIYGLDEGEICVGGQSVHFASARAAWAAGITAIHQEPVMFDELSVAENVFMGHMSVTGAGLVDWRGMQDRTNEILHLLEAGFSATTPLKLLGVAEKHLVEIARALSHDSRVVIMDEPTAALSTREVDDLIRIVGRLKAQGRAILFISHKFEEIFRIADRWVCLRDGRQVGSGAIADVTSADLVKLMVGRSIGNVFPTRETAVGEPTLQVDGLSNATEFADLSFVLHKGEILGLYGLVGSGRSEALQALFGLSRPTRGVIRIDGKVVAIHSPADAIAAGLAYVPEDRQTQGAVLAFSIVENVTLASLRRHSSGAFLMRDRETATARSVAERFAVKARNLDQALGDLSGGNQQKVVIGKWIATNPRILILDEPTKGIDIGSKAAVHAFMAELTAAGVAIILISSELPEVMGMSDSILVMHEGRVVRRLTRAEATPELIVTAAAGTLESNVA